MPIIVPISSYLRLQHRGRNDKSVQDKTIQIILRHSSVQTGGDRAGTRNGAPDTGFRQVPGLLPRDDLR